MSRRKQALAPCRDYEQRLINPQTTGSFKSQPLNESLVLSKSNISSQILYIHLRKKKKKSDVTIVLQWILSPQCGCWWPGALFGISASATPMLPNRWLQLHMGPVVDGLTHWALYTGLKSLYMIWLQTFQDVSKLLQFGWEQHEIPSNLNYEWYILTSGQKPTL